VLFSRVKLVYPAGRRVGVIYNPEASGRYLVEAQRAAKAAGILLVAEPVSEASGVKEAVARMLGRIDLLWLPPDPRLFSRDLFAYLLSFSLERKLPLVGFLESFTQAGALASISADYADVGERAGKLASAASREGFQRPPGGLAYAPGVLSLNLKIARALGVDVPARAIAQARKVFR